MEPNTNSFYFPFDLNTSPESFSNIFFFDLNDEPNGGEEDEQFMEKLDEDTTIDFDDGIIKTLRNTCNDERRVICRMLLQNTSVEAKLNTNDMKAVASMFSVSCRIVQRIWKQFKESETGDVSHRRTSNCGRKRVEIQSERVRGIPLKRRTTIRALSFSLNVSSTKAFTLVKEGEIRRHTNAIKPALNENNRKSRLQFCFSMLEESSLPHNPRFKGMYNIVHIDEKWFNMTRRSEKYYLLPDEDEPMRTCKRKNFIGKVMFFVAVARPRFDARGIETFSGKIGVFPFVTHEPTRRSSINRVAGTLVTKPITSVTKEVMRAYLVEKVIPAIKQKWPRDEIMHPIWIQQDNARTHIDCNDIEFCEAAQRDGFDIRLFCQPPNSPDLNVLDLGFFSTIQSLQYQESSVIIDELIDAFGKSFKNFSATKSNHVFLTLQLCMVEILKVRGCHKYKIPHINKEKLERNDNLPTQLAYNAALVQEVLDFLR